jgi:hypothetical protein
MLKEFFNNIRYKKILANLEVAKKKLIAELEQGDVKFLVESLQNDNPYSPLILKRR